MGELGGRDVVLWRQSMVGLADPEGGEEFVGAVDEELGIFDQSCGGGLDCGDGGRGGSHGGDTREFGLWGEQEKGV